MSGAQDNCPVYPEKQSSLHQFELEYHQYRHRIYNYLALKLNPTVAEDLTQQVFLKAFENLTHFNLNYESP